MLNKLSFRFSKIELLSILSILVLSLLLRVINLGYSELQGDEVRALYPVEASSLREHLLNQKKGPAQFIVTYLTQLALGSSSELVLRLPFAVFGVLSVLVLYLLVKELFGRRVGFLAALLFSVNGFFVAFSRIIQYQSIVIFFTLLTGLFVVLLEKTKKPVYLYLAAISAAVGILSHYDIAFASLFFIFYLLKHVLAEKKFKHVLLSILLFTTVIGSFYIPFLLHPNFSQNTTSYLFMRVTGDDGGNKITNTFVTYSIYNPLTTKYILIIFLIIAAIFQSKKIFSIVLWFVIPYTVLNYVATIPGTHIFTYVIPLLICFSYISVWFFNRLRFFYVKAIVLFMMSFFIILSFLQSWFLFVDHSPEYPWFKKRVLWKEVSLPDDKYHLSLFGFPYNRKLKEVDTFVKSQKGVGKISSNEGSKLLRYYIKPRDTNLITQDAYVYIYGAQSLKKSRGAVVKDLKPVLEVSRGETRLADLYLIPRKEVQGVNQIFDSYE